MIGRTISHYRILEKLGEGGMGMVYKAVDTRLGRTVALKFLSPNSLGDAAARARFLREAQAAAALDHPNICAVHGVEEADGQTFIVMAYVEGKSLHAAMRARPLSLREALETAVQIGLALKEAHDKGIVHRDIKSANVLISKSGAKLCDFGLALLADRSRITRPGTMLGTITYMSPEQALGKHVDRRTDIWSLGVVLYEMLTRRCPFPGSSAQTVIQAILKQQPPPVTSVNPQLPAELEWTLSKALAKDPNERYQHVDDFVVDLRRILKKIPAGATDEPPSPSERATTAPEGTVTLEAPANPPPED